MNILNELTSKLSPNYTQYFDKKEIENVLSVEGGLEDDVTIASGSHLELCHLRLIGRKNEKKLVEFQYDKPFYPGVNILISDNLKGKSTIFKSIKFALTGRDTLKKNMSEWIEYIFLEFKIGGTVYTTYIDKSSNRVKAQLYRSSLEKYDAKDIREIDLVFSALSKKEFENCCEKYFYKKLGVNSLKWTQKDSRKDVNRLNEAGTSWVTFFKTIYLESKDSSTLVYGSQGELLVQILLGLGLTLSMNKLKIKMELLQFESAKSDNLKKQPDADCDDIIEIIEKDLGNARTDLVKLQESEKCYNVSKLVREKSSLVLKIQSIEERKIAAIREKTEDQKKKAEFLDKKNNLENEWNKLSNSRCTLYFVDNHHQFSFPCSKLNYGSILFHRA